LTEDDEPVPVKNQQRKKWDHWEEEVKEIDRQQYEISLEI